MPPIVEYAGVTLGGSQAYSWELTSGVAPVDKALLVSKHRAEQLEGQLGQPGTLRIGDTTYKDIYLLEIQPGDDPFTKRIRLADKRWLLPKDWVSLSMNIRRATGDFRLAGGSRIENRLIQPELKYAEYSLYPPENPGDPWTPETALTYVVTQWLDLPIRFKDSPPAVEIVDLILEDPGDAAIERLLAYMPGMSMFVDREGFLTFYDTRSGDEQDIFDSLPAPQRAGGYASPVDRRYLRPTAVIVYFTPEVECRFDFNEVGSQQTDTPRLVNVAPIPDIQLDVNGETLARGTPVELTDLFDAWGAFGILNRKITLEDLRKTFTRYSTAGFEQLWGNNPRQPFNPVNAARVQAVTQAWRKLYRIDEDFFSRLQSVSPFRASVLNPQTGAYAPSEAYCDWIRRPCYNGIINANDPNVNQGWAARGYAELLDNAIAAPAKVSPVNLDLGLIRVDPALDPYGLFDRMLLGYAENLPSGDKSKALLQQTLAFGMWNKVELTNDFKLSTILTVTPGSPNTRDRLWYEVVTGEQVGEQGGVGPIVFARVFPGVMSARFAWEDSARDLLIGAIKGENPYPRDQLINTTFVRNVAEATAKRIYDTLRDQPLGSLTVDRRPGLEPAGAVGAIRQDMTGGRLTSTVNFQAVTQPRDIWRFLDASTRRAILRTLDAPVANF